MHQNVFLLSSASRAGRLRNWDLSCGSPLMPDRKGAMCKGHAVQSMWTCKHTLQSAAHAVFVMWTWGRGLKGRGVCIEARGSEGRRPYSDSWRHAHAPCLTSRTETSLVVDKFEHFAAL